jgi:hypothetical protein
MFLEISHQVHSFVLGSFALFHLEEIERVLSLTHSVISFKEVRMSLSLSST